MSQINKGKIFEAEFKDSTKKQNIWIYRLRDSYVVNKQYDPNAYIVTQPADYLIHYEGELFFAELKTTDKKFITIAHDDKQGQVKLHQQDDLLSIVGEHEHGVFIFQFERETENQMTYAMTIQDFIRFREQTNRASITPLLCVQYGGIVIQSTKLRIKYAYDVKSMLKSILRKGDSSYGCKED